jgi:hypothetical protein
VNDYLILIIREFKSLDNRGYQVRTPTWDPSGDQTQYPTYFFCNLIANTKYRLCISVIIGEIRGVAQLVARTAGGREVAGSSPVTPTRILNK